MRWLKRILERYFDVPEVHPGHDTAWKFDPPWPWPTWVPDWLMLFGIPLLIALVALVYWRDARSAALRTRLTLTGLRLAEIILVIIFLSNFTLSVDGTELPVVVVLVDRSASMSLDDHYSDERTAKAVRELLTETGQKKPSRINLARGLLTRREGQFLKDLQEYHRLHLYLFAGDARRFGRGEFLSARDVDAVLPELKRRLLADGEVTNHRAALKQVLEDLSGSPPSAIILLTDGITTSGPNDTLSQAAGLSGLQSVPVFVVPLGSTDPARDLEISGLRAPEVAFLDDPITFTADLRAFGVDAKRVTLKLYRKGEAAPLVTQSVAPPADGKKKSVSVSFTPRKQGAFEFRLEVTPLPDEANTANNSQSVRVYVKREKLKVLLADSTPRYEFRYLKHLLEREKSVTLHTILQDSDKDYAAEDATAKELQGRFPLERSKLFAYDAIILGDLDVSSFPRDVLENLAAYVTKGGSLVFVAGPYFNPVTYFNTPLKSLLPFEIDGVKPPADDEHIDAGYRPVLTAAGQGRPMLQLSGPRGRNADVWKELPPLYWLLEIRELKPGAQTLLEHPSRTAQMRPGEAGRRNPLPVVVLQRVGAGKVLFHATDETWRWRRLVGDLYFGRYWMQSLRSLYNPHRLGQTRDAELEADRREYLQGQTPRLTLRFLDAGLAPKKDDGVVVIVQRNGVIVDRPHLRRDSQRRTEFSADLPHVAEGNYRVTVQIPDFPKGAPTTTFTVVPPQKELRVRTANPSEWTAIAKETDGAVVSLQDAADLPARIPRGKPTPLNNPKSVPLWNRWELLLLFAGLIVWEWLLRKRLRLV